MNQVTNTYQPPESNPLAIAMSHSLFQIFCYTSVIALAFTAVFLTMLKTIPVPIMIQKVEDSKERTKRFRYYVGYILSWAHAPVTTSLGIFFLIKNGTTYCDPNNSAEIWLVYVRNQALKTLFNPIYSILWVISRLTLSVGLS